METISTDHLRVLAAAVRAAPLPVHGTQASQSVAPFVTISREGGAGGHTIGRLLVDRLNKLAPGPDPWQLWDKELVEKVAREHHLSPDSVASLGESHRTWLEEFMASLSQAPDADEAWVYRRVAMTIRALAQHGRAVIVGRGGAYVTRKMPGGIHCRLVAPIAFRAQNMAHQLGLSLDAAMEHVRTLDRNRAAFHRRYWPQDAYRDEVYSVTLNMALTPEDRAIAALLALVLPER
jgi:cytidylate kinase